MCVASTVKSILFMLYWQNWLYQRSSTNTDINNTTGWLTHFRSPICCILFSFIYVIWCYLWCFDPFRVMQTLLLWFFWEKPGLNWYNLKWNLICWPPPVVRDEASLTAAEMADLRMVCAFLHIFKSEIYICKNCLKSMLFTAELMLLIFTCENPEWCETCFLLCTGSVWTDLIGFWHEKVTYWKANQPFQNQRRAQEMYHF